MLLLTRKLGEEIYITLPDGRLVVVAVTMIDRGRCRLGVQADRDIQIDRKERVDNLAERGEERS